MSARYVLDTNVYTATFHSDTAREQLTAFVLRNTPRLFLHSVVAQELLVGAYTDVEFQELNRRLIEPFESLGRIITPSHQAWKRAAYAVVRLMEKKVPSPGGYTRSLLNDCLLAASAQDHGYVLVTSNRKDMQRIAAVLPFRFAAPFPE